MTGRRLSTANVRRGVVVGERLTDAERAVRRRLIANKAGTLVSTRAVDAPTMQTHVGVVKALVDVCTETQTQTQTERYTSHIRQTSMNHGCTSCTAQGTLTTETDEVCYS